MGFVVAADPASKTQMQFISVAELHNAIQQFGFIPMRPDGGQMFVQEFEGGFLLDGAPINVWLGEGWFEGQRELLEPFWRTGQIPTPPQSVLNSVIVPMPEDVREDYEAYVASKDGGIFGANKGLVMAGAAALMFLMFMRR